LLTNALEYRREKVLISDEKWQECLTDLKCDSKEDLYIKIALSDILISFVLNKLNEKECNVTVNRINIKSTKGNPINFAHCCYPIPSDRVAGILTKSKGLVLHQFDCGNLVRAKHKGEQWMEVNWQVDKGESFKVKIHVKIENRRGMLALIANTIIKININIENIELEEREHVMEGLNLVIKVPNIAKLDEAMYAIKNLEFVHSVERSSNRKKKY
jgi:GTP pyrophosphokinase